MGQAKRIFFAIGCFILWSLLCTLACGEINYIAFIRLALFVSIFFIVCKIPNKGVINIAIIVVGALQAVWAILQQCGIAGSNSPYFEVTGFSRSSGILGGFQAIALATALLCQKKTNKVIPFALVSIPLLYSMLISGSRAAIPAFAFATAFLFREKISALVKAKKWFVFPVCLILIVSIVSLYLYRPESANARLLIWKVTAGIIQDNPIFGIGPGRFRAEYMLYQAKYFTENPTSIFASVADNAAYPYNEYLRITTEYGIIGLFLLMFFIFTLFKNAADKDQTCPLLALLVFSCFSFPTENPLTSVLFPSLAGCCYTWKSTNSNKAIVSVISAFSFLVTAASGIWLYLDTEKHIDKLKNEFCPISERVLFQRLPHIYTNIRFNSIYWHLQEKYAKLQEPEKSEYILPTCENWCSLGCKYLGNGNLETAEKVFREACCMIPTRMLPKYYLWKVLLMQGRDDEADELADTILTLKVKVDNTTTLRIIQEVKNSL